MLIITLRSCGHNSRLNLLAAPEGSPGSSGLNLLGDVVTTPPNQPPPSSSVALHFAGREFGVVSLITGIPFLLPEGQQWVESRTGQSIAFDKLSPARPPWEKQRAVNSGALLMSLQTQNPFELPSQSVVEIYLDMYRGALMRIIFPILDPVLFRETIKAAYQPQSSNRSYRPASTRACIFAFTAFAAALHPPGLNQTPPNVPPVDIEAFIIKAQCLLPQILQESTTLDGLQTATILVSHKSLHYSLLPSANMLWYRPCLTSCQVICDLQTTLSA